MPASPSPHREPAAMTQHQKLDPTTIHDTPAKVSDLLNLHELVAKARANLNQNNWDYIVGGTETETTMLRNRLALERSRCARACCATWARSMPRSNFSAASCGCRSCSVRSAPWRRLIRRAAQQSCEAAHEFGVAHMLSSVCEPGLEAVARGGARCAADVSALCPRRSGLGGRACRARDGAGLRRVLPHRRHRSLQPPRARHRQAHVTTGRRRASGNEFQAALDWRRSSASSGASTFRWPSRASPPPRTRESRVDHGVEFIYVSNHGGRQLDHGRGAIEVLPEIVDAVAGRANIIVDGSFCRGTDILEIQRLRLPNPLDLYGGRPEPLIPRARVAEVGERLRADGAVDTPLDEAGVSEARSAARASRASRGSSISFLHAYRDASHERRARALAERAAPGVPVSASHEVWPQTREYERTALDGGERLRPAEGAPLPRGLRGGAGRARGAGRRLRDQVQRRHHAGGGGAASDRVDAALRAGLGRDRRRLRGQPRPGSAT